MKRAALLLLTACAPDAGTPERSGPAAGEPALVARQFGAGIDPARVIATVGDASITSGEVAAYLELFPALTTRQAVDDLIDLHRASAAAEGSAAEGLETVARDARLRGRALAYLRRFMEQRDGSGAVSEAQIDAALRDPAYSVFYGLPERVRATHLLVMTPPASAAPRTVPAAPRDAQRRYAERLLGELRALGRPVTALDLRESFVRHRNEAAAAGMELHKDEGMVFPRRFSGRPRWQGAVARVVDPFADACFAAKVGDLIGPVETEFGFHLIVVEERYPEVAPPVAERRERIARFLAIQARQGDLKAELERLAAEQSVVPYPENIRAVSRSAVDQMRARTQSTFGVQRP